MSVGYRVSRKNGNPGLYFLSVLFYLPTILLWGLSMAGEVFGFGQEKWLMVILALAILWLVSVANLAGVSAGKWTSGAGGIATFLVAGLFMAAGIYAWVHGGPATPARSLAPEWNWQNLNFWSQIALAFTGLELGAIMAGEIRDPKRTIPRAAWISAAVISSFYIGGTLAILALMPPGRIDILSGLVQAAQVAAARFGWTRFALLLAVLILVSAAGTFGSWLGGSARLPFVIGIDEYLPRAFARLHPKWRTPYLALLMQAAICTLFLIAMTAGETLRAGYQLLVDLTTITTLLPFLYLFGAGWKNGYRVSATCGLAVTALAITLTFVPPDGASWLYELKLLGGCAAVVAGARMNFRYALARWRTQAL